MLLMMILFNVHATNFNIRQYTHNNNYIGLCKEPVQLFYINNLFYCIFKKH